MIWFMVYKVEFIEHLGFDIFCYAILNFNITKG